MLTKLRLFIARLNPLHLLNANGTVLGVETDRKPWPGSEGRWQPSKKDIALLPEAQRLGHECKEDDDDYWTLIPGQSSGMSGESKFQCRECGSFMFRGGWGSSTWLERRH